MIIFMRTVMAKPGKLPEVIAFANDMARIAGRATGTEVKVLLPVAGKFSEIAWVSRFDDLAQFEAANAKLFQDESYVAMLRKADGLFVDASGYDRLWREA